MTKYKMQLTWEELDRPMKEYDFNAPSDKVAIKTCSDILKWEYHEHHVWEDGQVGIKLWKMIAEDYKLYRKSLYHIVMANGRLKVNPGRFI